MNVSLCLMVLWSAELFIKMIRSVDLDFYLLFYTPKENRCTQQILLIINARVYMCLLVLHDKIAEGIAMFGTGIDYIDWNKT